MRTDQAKFQWAVHEALHHAERAFDHIGSMSMQEFSRHPMAIDAAEPAAQAPGYYPRRDLINGVG